MAICTKDRLRLLQGAVKSVLSQMTEGEELLIIDNSSRDGTSTWLEDLVRNDLRVRVIPASRPGIPVARNLALRHAKGNYLISLDDDEIAAPDWLSSYRKFLGDSSPERLGCVGGPTIALHEIPCPKWLGADFGTLDHQVPIGPLDHPIGPGAGNCAYVVSAALKVGGFSENLDRHEDTDLNNRLRDAGYEVWWLPDARTQHVIPPERTRFKSQLRFWYREGQNAGLLRLQQHPPGGKRFAFRVLRLLITPFQAGFQILAALGCLSLGRLSASARLTFRACRTIGMSSRLWSDSTP
ncbi:MAG: glycosyltransferase [Verrucomicrobiales bacterium]